MKKQSPVVEVPSSGVALPLPLPLPNSPAFSSGETFTCVVIGEGSLPIQCCEMLQGAGHSIVAVSSSDPTVLAWAQKNMIPTVSTPSELHSFLCRQPFDFLFSINNPIILASDVLTLPRVWAINYHDALLPRYAGLHATSWALLAGEQRHGITWHIMTATTDAGDLLKQKAVEISGKETAFTLNAKCYEAALKAFEELVQELKTGQAQPRKQDVSQRTYFGMTKRPEAGCVIDWGWEAERIERFVHALDFGPYENPLGLPKMYIDNKFVLVGRVERLDSRSGAAPGTIVGINESGMQLATSTEDIVAKDLQSLEGLLLSEKELLQTYGARPGMHIQSIPEEIGKRLTLLNVSICKHERYWRKCLEGLHDISLPYVKLKGGEQSEYGKREVTIPDGLLHLADKENGFAVITAAVASYLGRISGATEFDLGLSMQLLRQEWDGLSGFCALSVPMHIRLEECNRFSEVAEGVRNQIMEVTKRKAYARDTVQRYPKLRRRPELSRTEPLSLIVAEVQDNEPDFLPRGVLTVAIGKSGKRMHWLYDRAQLGDENVERMVSQFDVFVQGFLANPNYPIGKHPLLTKSEWQQIVVEWNRTERNYPQGICIHDLFEQQVERRPDAVAVEFEGKKLTYEQLNVRANQVARHLRGLGVGPDVLVGICMERSLEMIVAMFGVLKAGGAYVPMDPTYPSERLVYTMEDSRAPVLLTQERLLTVLGEQRARIVCLDRDWDDIACYEDANPRSEVTERNLAYIIYTSGSTGRPKGVAIEHRSVVVLIHWALEVYTNDECAGTLASTSICFDLSVFEIFTTLARGCEVILVQNALQLPQLANPGQVTLVNTVPSAMTELVRMNGVPSSVCTINLAGEPLTTSLVNTIYQIRGVKKVYDLYGPSEDTTYSTFALRKRDAPATIGRPLPNTQVYIVDRHLQPVPVGVPGELYIAGAGLARGYLNKPELTGERFIRNLFDSTPNSRMYRTGDLARYMMDGNIEFLGRVDHQVKIRGFRIELGEIETLLNRHPNIRECVVDAREDSSGTKNLISYVVVKHEPAPSISDLRSFLKGSLPDYMVPQAYVVLDALPLTPNGKVDRKALPAPEIHSGASRGELMAPRDILEQQLTKLWEKLFDLSPIGIRDNFFELGGHSILAVRLFKQIEKLTGKNLPMVTLFQAPTIEQLAAILRRDGWKAPWQSLIPIKPDGSKPPFYCIHGVGGNILEYLDLAKYMDPDQPFYGIQAWGMNIKGRPKNLPLEEMARYYVKEIREFQAHGPYYLGGSSFGGLAGLEIAQQLRAQGEEVALLAFFDTNGPGYPKPLPAISAWRRQVYDFIQRIDQHLGNFLATGWLHKWDYITTRAKRFKNQQLKNWKRRERGIGKLRDKIERQLMPKDVRKVDQAGRWAAAQYVPKPYGGRITLFRATMQSWGIVEDRTLGWGPLAHGGIEIYDTPGYHGAIVRDPRAKLLAEQLKDALRKAQVSMNGKNDLRVGGESVSIVESKSMVAVRN